MLSLTPQQSWGEQSWVPFPGLPLYLAHPAGLCLPRAMCLPALGQDPAEETDCYSCLFTPGMARAVQSINVCGVSEWQGEMAG